MDKDKIVLMQHGLMNTAETFMVFEANYNWTTAFLQNNYTVFLGNFRGNGYSCKH